MYYIALNVLNNMNTSRISLYREMRRQLGNNVAITENQILQIGHKLGLPDYVTKYEHDGCEYANFIVTQNGARRLSEKAKTDFALYDSDTKYKLSEIPITIDISRDFLELKMNRVDTIDEVCEEKLLSEKWSRNRSLQRYRKKVDFTEKLKNEVKNLIEIFGERGVYAGSTEKLLKTYGRKRKNVGDWSAWMNFRGCYLSNTLSEYEALYASIFAYTNKAVEWGGKELSEQKIKELCKKTDVDFEQFVERAMADGMLRETAVGYYAITGYAAMIHKCLENGFHFNRLSAIIRKPETNCFELLIGDNSLYSEKVRIALAADTREIENHWFVYETDRLEKITAKLIDLVKSFEIHEEYLYWNKEDVI